MKRRRFVQALAAIPAASPLLAQQPQPVTGGGRGAVPDDTKLEVNVAEAVADSQPHFFSAPQFSALRRLSDILAPASAASPGALAAGAPEFLDFLIGKSDPERQTVYRAGLDALNAQAHKQFNKPFADTDAAQADRLMASLRAPWTWEEPSDPAARFLRAAKSDVRTATANSRAAAGSAPVAGRRMSGSGLYWYPLD
jgi:hypothetical protein